MNEIRDLLPSFENKADLCRDGMALFFTVEILLLSSLFSGTNAANPDTLFKQEWSKNHLLYNVGIFQKKFPQCTFDFHRADSLYYMGWFGQLKTLKGTSLGRFSTGETLNGTFRELSCSYLNDSSLIKDMEFNAAEVFRSTGRSDRYSAITGACIGSGMLLLLLGGAAAYGNGSEGTMYTFMIGSGACFTGGAVMTVVFVVNEIKGYPYWQRMVKNGKKIISAANIKYLRNCCGMEKR